jgi:hypothetical protein
MSVAAAFTDASLKYVVGDYVCGGRFVGQSPDVESGYCAFIKGKIYIRPLDERSDRIIIKAVENKGDFFRQMLLIYHQEAVRCTIFDKFKPTFRRAFAENERGSFVVIETEERVSIQEFQKMMLKIGIKNAIYLDMGTWSEGFYRNQENEMFIIGKQTQSTKYQTNWLIFEQIE